MTPLFTEVQFTPECHTILEAWQTGSLSYKDAIEKLMLFSGNAAAQGHPLEEGSAELALGSLLHFRGNLSRSFHHLMRARSLYSLAVHQNGMAYADLLQAQNYAYTGHIRMATSVFHTVYEIASSTGNDILKAEAAVQEGIALLSVSKSSAALNQLEHALTQVKALPEGPYRNQLLVKTYDALAETNLAQRRPENAWAEALNGWSISKQDHSTLVKGYAHRAIGRVIMSLNGSPYPPEFDDDATKYLQTAVNAFNQADNEPEMARTNFLLAKCYAANRQHSQARQLMQKTLLLFTRLGMVEDADHAAHFCARIS